jgi:hypothetical protein
MPVACIPVAAVHTEFVTVLHTFVGEARIEAAATVHTSAVAMFLRVFHLLNLETGD